SIKENKEMRTLLLAITLHVLSGCTTVYYKAGATQEEYQKDISQCEYEVSLHVNQVDNSYSTMVGQEFDLALRKRDLIKQCMLNKAWEIKKQ
ncbi:MAG: hypothetical protein ACXVKO_09300, partial [Bacteriovorax sp.]